MPPSLGDCFPKEIKEDYLGRKISPKSILLIKIPEFTEIKYPKFAILVNVSDCGNFIGSVCINTEKPFSNNCITLTKREYDFLDYDSHVNCDHLSDMELKKVSAFLLERPENILGEITDFQHIQIIQRLNTSRVITGKLKKKFGLI